MICRRMREPSAAYNIARRAKTPLPPKASTLGGERVRNAGRTWPDAEAYCFWVPDGLPEVPPDEPLEDPPVDDLSPWARPVSVLLPPPDLLSPVLLVPVVVLDLLSPVLLLSSPRTEVPPRVVVREWIEVRLRSRSSTPTRSRWPRRISTRSLSRQ